MRGAVRVGLLVCVAAARFLCVYCACSAIGSTEATYPAPYLRTLKDENPQVLEQHLEADKNQNDAADDGRGLLVARTEEVPHGNARERQNKRDDADERC